MLTSSNHQSIYIAAVVSKDRSPLEGYSGIKILIDDVRSLLTCIVMTMLPAMLFSSIFASTCRFSHIDNFVSQTLREVMADKLTRIAIVKADKCKPKRCRQECKKSCPVVRMGKLCIEVTPTDKMAYISEELCIGCGICVKVGSHLKIFV